MLVAVEKRSEKRQKNGTEAVVCAGCRHQLYNDLLWNVGSKTLHQQIPPVLNWRFQLTQFIKQMALGFFVAVENY